MRYIGPIRPIPFALLLAAALAMHGVALAGADELKVKRQGETRYVSGGVGDAEQEAIRAKAADFGVWLTFAAPNGAYLSSVDVRIENDRGKTVLETKTDGPFLLVDLASGRYEVRAVVDDRRVETRTMDVPSEGQSRMYMTLEKRASGESSS